MGSRIGAITFGGLSSGLPTDDIIKKLLDLSRRPITLLEKQRDDTSERLDLFRDLNSKTTALRDVLRGLDNMADVIRRDDDKPLASAFEEFREYEASSSDESKATVSVGRNATAGSLVFSIEQLAQQHRSLSGTAASADTVIAAGGGTLSIQIGTGAATNIAIAAGSTVQGVVDAINATGIDATAFLIDDGQGAVRIGIVGEKSGTDQSLTITNDFGLAFTTTQAAQNARIVLDPGSSVPVTIERSTNKFENVIQGLTLEAKGLTAGQNVTVTIETSSSAVKKSLTALVDAYNAIADVIVKQNTIDPKTGRGGPLLGDATMMSLSQQLGGSLARSYGTGSVSSTAQLGIRLTPDGHLKVDEAQLDAMLESDFEGVAGFVAGADGFADQFRQVLDRFVDPTNLVASETPTPRGLLVARVTGTSRRIADLEDSIAKGEARLDDFEANLVKQFAALEDSLAQMQQQSSFLTSFLTSLQSR